MSQFDVLDTETVCALLGVSDRTLRTWVKDYGCPSKQEGRNRTFVWSEVLEWYVGYKSSLENGVSADFAGDQDEEEEDIRAVNLRKTKAEADLRQLQLSKLRGEVIPIADARVRAGRMMGNLRTALLGLPQSLGPALEGVKDPAEREAIIRERVEAVCRDLSTGAIVGGGEVDETPAGSDEVVHDGDDAVEISAAAVDESLGITPDLVQLCREIIAAAPSDIALELENAYARS